MRGSTCTLNLGNLVCVLQSVSRKQFDGQMAIVQVFVPSSNSHQ